MNIRVFENFDDAFLQSEWERLANEGDIFPQSSYHWCATWWKYLSGRRTLHIIMVVDYQGRAVAIAPMCIERHFGIKVLRSFPIHFGDYYTFITSSKEVGTAVETILQYITSTDKWNWVRLEQVVETDVMTQSLRAVGFVERRLTGSVIVDLHRYTWEEYLLKLQRKFRQNIRNRQRRIDKAFEAKLNTILIWEKYEVEYTEMVAIHEQRWCDDNAPHKSAIQIACWLEAIKGQFEAGKMVYYQLLFNNDQVAYRLGFIHQGTYYDWHTGFNPKYRDYYPGIMIMSYMIRDFMEQGVASINFMAGEYGWKLDWSPDRTVVSHYMFSSPSTNYRAAFLNFYHHRLRDYLKDWYHAMMENRILRALSRKIICLQQKMAGQR